MGERKYEYLPKVIKRTRRARIEAEHRFRSLDALTKHSTVYYACWTTGLTLATLYFDYWWLPFFSVVAAIIVALFSVYTSSQNYGVRAEQMKHSYLALHELWLSFDGVHGSEAEQDVFADKAGEKYVAILRQTENHLSRDDVDSRTKLDSMRIWVLRVAIYGAPIVSLAVALFASGAS